jgi:hypothetical protein
MKSKKPSITANSVLWHKTSKTHSGRLYIFKLLFITYLKINHPNRRHNPFSVLFLSDKIRAIWQKFWEHIWILYRKCKARDFNDVITGTGIYKYNGKKWRKILTNLYSIPGHFFNSEHSPHILPTFNPKKHRSMHCELLCNQLYRTPEILKYVYVYVYGNVKICSDWWNWSIMCCIGNVTHISNALIGIE